MTNKWKKISTPRSGSVQYPLEVVGCRIQPGVWYAQSEIAYELRDETGRRIGLKVPSDGFAEPNLKTGQILKRATVAFSMVAAERGARLNADGTITAADAQDDWDDAWDEEYYGDELPIGTVIGGGQFTIKKFLSSGGFGMTYFADDNLGRSYVIKECFPASISRRRDSRVTAMSRDHRPELKKFIALFVKEAHILASINYRNVVSVQSCFEENNTAYMALAKVVGNEVGWNIKNRPEGLTPEYVVDMTRTLLNTLDVIHAEGILHRDLSPSNIMIDMEGEPVLIDFGAARAAAMKGSRAVSTHAVVKDGYSPKELYVEGAPQSPATDLYALAATLFHIITGTAPEAADVRDFRMQSGEPDPVGPLSGRYPAYDAAFLGAIDQCLSIRMIDRHKTARDWLNALDQPHAKPASDRKTKPAPDRKTKPAPDRKAKPEPAQSDTPKDPPIPFVDFIGQHAAARSRLPANNEPVLPEKSSREVAVFLAKYAKTLESTGQSFGAWSVHDLEIIDGNLIQIRNGFETVRSGTKIHWSNVPAKMSPYMSPCFAVGAGVGDAKSDVYVIGAILLYCLTGKTPPAPGNDRKAILKALRIPDGMRYGLERALAVDPAARPTLQEFVDYLEGTKTPPKTTTETPKPREKKNKPTKQKTPSNEARPDTDGDTQSGFGTFFTWASRIFIGALLGLTLAPFALNASSNIVLSPLFPAERLGILLFDKQNVSIAQLIWPLVLFGAAFAWLSMLVRKPARRLSLFGAFLVGYQILPILFTKQNSVFGPFPDVGYLPTSTEVRLVFFFCALIGVAVVILAGLFNVFVNRPDNVTVVAMIWRRIIGAVAGAMFALAIIPVFHGWMGGNFTPLWPFQAVNYLALNMFGLPDDQWLDVEWISFVLVAISGVAYVVLMGPRGGARPFGPTSLYFFSFLSGYLVLPGFFSNWFSFESWIAWDDTLILTGLCLGMGVAFLIIMSVILKGRRVS